MMPLVLARLFLVSLGLLYIGLGIWCLLRSSEIQKSLELIPSGNSGRSEFLTIYGGLEIGLGLMFLLGGVAIGFTLPALVAASLIHLGIVAVRLSTLAIYSPLSKMIYNLTVAECAILIIAFALTFWTHAWRLTVGGVPPTS